MNGAGADSGVTRVRMIVPVVVIGDVVGFFFALHTLEIALAVVPEVVVGVGDIGGGFGIQRTVSIGLVSI